MKKYFSFLLVLSMMFTVGANTLFAQTQNPGHDCVPGQTYDTRTGTPCANIATCIGGETINHINGKPCGIITLTTNTTNIVSNTSGTKSFANYLADSLSPMSYGDTGWNVTAIQAFLNQQGFLSVVTGRNLSLTRKAVIGFQQSQSLTADGIVGPKTINAIISILKSNPVLAGAVGSRASSTLPIANSTKKPISLPAQITLADSPACDPPHDGTDSQTYNAVITNDNFFEIGAWNPTTENLRFIDQNDGGSISTNVLDDSQMSWRLPKAITFTLAKGEKLLIAAFNDERMADGLLGQFSSKDANGTVQTSVTKGLLFDKMRTDMLKPDLSHGLAFDSVLINEIKNGTWVPATEIGKNGMAPWGTTDYISHDAMWLNEWGVKEADNHITLFMSKGDGNGSFPPCNSCPAGTTGTYPNCVAIPNVTINGICRGTAWPALSYIMNVTFDQAVVVDTANTALKVTGAPNNHGVVLNYTGISADNKTVSFGFTAATPDPNNYSYADYTGDGNVMFLPTSSIKTLTGTAIDLSSKYPIPSSIHCAGPADNPKVLSVIEGSCTGAMFPNLKQTLTIKFSDNVKIVQSAPPKIEIAGVTNPVVMSYVSGTGTNTLTFTSPTVNDSSWTYQSWVGNHKFEFVSGTVIQSAASGTNLDLAGSWDIPTSIKCPGALVQVASVVEDCNGTFPNYTHKMTVNFSEAVNTIPNTVKLKINKLTGEIFSNPILATGGLSAVFSHIGTIGNPAAYDDTTGDVAFVDPATDAAKITSVASGAISNLTGTWTPTGTACTPPSNPNTPTVPYVQFVHSLYNSNTKEMNLQVTFSTAVKVTGGTNLKMRIQSDPTKEYDIRGQSSDHKTITFGNGIDANITPPPVEFESLPTGTKVTDWNDATINADLTFGSPWAPN